MSDNILGSTLLALILALAVGAAGTLLGDDRPGEPTQVVQLPQVTVTGHRLPPEPADPALAKAPREPLSAPGEKSG
ncbi:MAG TPA: hypothetical protein VF169_23715 [Albitalea sp.]|uniref:hypothetical protein n=1 Tax=Piscinibacter sp. TaxID=1903157 RepID=UPI002ED46113